MVSTYTDTFEVAWRQAEDAEKTWLLDATHFPRPISPLTQDLLDKVMVRIFNARVAFVNGYSFILDEIPPEPTQEVIERGPVPIWRDDYQPRIEAFCRRVRAGSYGDMTAPELAAHFEELTDEAVEVFRLTMVLVFAFMGPTMELVVFSEAELGLEGPRLAAAVLQGFENESSESGAGLGRLAELALSLPQVADALRGGRHAALSSVEGGDRFLEAFQEYLDKYGWRPESWGLQHRPTWAENPSLPLLLIGRYIRDPERSPATAMRRAVEQREEALREIQARLDPEKLQRFHAMLEASKDHVLLSEGRALWQHLIIGSLRVPALALGEKLVQLGALLEPGDIYFLTLAEVKAAASEPSSEYSGIAAQRKRDMAKWEGMNAPPFIGAPPRMEDVPPEMLALMKHFFGIEGPPDIQGGVVKGFPASKGVVKGRARVLHDLTQADLLEPGEVLVCSTTAPPWTPLFAVASAVVTDSGGVLSHSAICAREYGIPCVVGTQIATRVIATGALVTVDGAAGTVTIEP